MITVYSVEFADDPVYFFSRLDTETRIILNR